MNKRERQKYNQEERQCDKDKDTEERKDSYRDMLLRDFCIVFCTSNKPLFMNFLAPTSSVHSLSPIW
jgi:hypothetical protein